MGNCCSTRANKAVDLREPLLGDAERDAVSNLLQYLGNHANDSAYWSEALGALTTLSFSSNVELQRSAALTFSEVIKPDNAPATRELIYPILRLLQSSDVQIQRAASFALSNLTVNDLNKLLIVELGGLDPLVKLLSSPSIEVQRTVCGCFTDLSTADMNKVRIVSSGALVPLVQLCYSEDSRTVRNASGALLNLTHADKNRPALVRAGCLAVFVRLLRSPETDVQYFCAAALSNIAVDGEHRRLLLAHVDELLSGLISLLSSTSSQLQIQACLALLNLASDEDYQLHIVKRNGVQPLLQLIRFSMDQPAVLVAAVAVLRNISIHPLNEAHLVENHCVQLLLDVIRKFSKHGQAANLNRTIYDIFCHCVSTLRNISATDANRDNILQYDGVEDVMALLSLPDAPKQLLSEVAAAITVFALSPSLCTRLAEMGVVEQIVALASSDSPDVQGHAAAALGNLVGSPVGAQKFMECWDSAAVYLLQFLQSSNPALPHIATWTIYEICRNPEMQAARDRVNATTEVATALRQVLTHPDAEISRLASKTVALLEASS